LGRLRKVDWLLADREHDADWLREALEDIGISACTPGRNSHKKTGKYDRPRCKTRNPTKITFGPTSPRSLCPRPSWSGC